MEFVFARLPVLSQKNEAARRFSRARLSAMLFAIAVFPVPGEPCSQINRLLCRLSNSVMDSRIPVLVVSKHWLFVTLTYSASARGNFDSAPGDEYKGDA